MLPQVFFYQVDTLPHKLLGIYRICYHLFSKGERLVIRVLDKKAASFVDELLWKSPPESFLPHECVEGGKSESPVVITMKEGSPNDAPHLLNLTPLPVESLGNWRSLYELEDRTNPEKREASHHRFRHYTQKGCATSTFRVEY